MILDLETWKPWCKFAAGGASPAVHQAHTLIRENPVQSACSRLGLDFFSDWVILQCECGSVPVMGASTS